MVARATTTRARVEGPLVAVNCAALPEVEKHTILAALLGAPKGNRTKATAALGITRTKLYTRLRRFGLPLE